MQYHKTRPMGHETYQSHVDHIKAMGFYRSGDSFENSDIVKCLGVDKGSVDKILRRMIDDKVVERTRPKTNMAYRYRAVARNWLKVPWRVSDNDVRIGMHTPLEVQR